MSETTAKTTTTGGIIPKNKRGEVRKTWIVTGGEAKKVTGNPTGTRKPAHPREKERAADARLMEIERRQRSNEEQLHLLDQRFGKGLGASKERAKLLGFPASDCRAIKDYVLAKQARDIKLESAADVTRFLEKIKRGG
jgi:hypothetical protein